MKKYALIAGLALAMGFSTVLFGCEISNSSELAYVSLDINPSIDMVLDAKDRVQTVTAMNQDGEVLLEGLALQGLKLEAAVEAIIDEAIDLGYIDPEAEDTTVTCDGSAEKVRNKLHEYVNTAFQNRGIMGSAIAKQNTELLAEAEELGVTVGFLRLVYRALEADDELLKEDALLLTQQELIQIIKDKNAAMKQVMTEMKEQFFAERQELMDYYLPLIIALETEIAELEAELEAYGEPTTENEADIAALETEIAAKVAELEALREELHAAMTALRTEFHNDGEAIREQIRIRKQERIQEHQAEVEAFRNQMRERRQEMQEAIAAFQEQHKNTTTTTTTTGGQGNGNNG